MKRGLEKNLLSQKTDEMNKNPGPIRTKDDRDAEQASVTKVGIQCRICERVCYRSSGEDRRWQTATAYVPAPFPTACVSHLRNAGVPR
jgi:hypothetical protein